MSDATGKLGVDVALQVQNVLVEILRGWDAYVKDVAAHPELANQAEKKMFDEAEAAYDKLKELYKGAREDNPFYKSAKELVEAGFDPKHKYESAVDLVNVAESFLSNQGFSLDGIPSAGVSSKLISNPGNKSRQREAANQNQNQDQDPKTTPTR